MLTALPPIQRWLTPPAAIIACGRFVTPAHHAGALVAPLYTKDIAGDPGMTLTQEDFVSPASEETLR